MGGFVKDGDLLGLGRVVVINPNSTQAVTDAIDAAVAPFRFADGPAIECRTLAEGPPGIESQKDADSVVAPLCRLVSTLQGQSDAFVIACFGDPGLSAVRAITDRPVFGIAQAAYSAAIQAGERFGVIAILEDSVPRHRNYIRKLGLEQRYTFSRAIGARVTELEGEGVLDRMFKVGRRLVDEDGTDVLILGCAGMARYRAVLAVRLGVPVIDPCQAGVVQAIATVRLDRSIGSERNQS